MAKGHKMSRYARQAQLPEVNEAGQAAIRAARVLVVGVGGLAAPALQYLVGAGVGHLTLVDGDVVSLSNLHRQTLFREADINLPKAQAAADTLRNLNSDCVVETVAESLTPANATGLVANATLVLDCADSFAVSYILSDACHAAETPLISASALGFAGYVGGFCGTAPSLRAVFPDLPDHAATCATVGVMGPVVGMIGAAQAQLALAHIIGQEPAPLGQLISFDMQNFRTSGFRFDGTPEPEQQLGFIHADDLAQDDFIVELRGPDEARNPVHPTARRINVADFKAQTLTPDRAQRAVFACRSGLRAWQAGQHLQSYWAGDISLIAMGEMPEIKR